MAKEVWTESADSNAVVSLDAYAQTIIFPVGKPNDAYAKYFIGQSYTAPIVTEGVPVVNVTFEPGRRVERRGLVPSPLENFGTSAADLVEVLAIVGLIALVWALLVWFWRKSQASRLSQCFDSIAINSKDRSSGCLR